MLSLGVNDAIYAESSHPQLPPTGLQHALRGPRSGHSGPLEKPQPGLPRPCWLESRQGSASTLCTGTWKRVSPADRRPWVSGCFQRHSQVPAAQAWLLSSGSGALMRTPQPGSLTAQTPYAAAAGPPGPHSAASEGRALRPGGERSEETTPDFRAGAPPCDHAGSGPSSPRGPMPLVCGFQEAWCGGGRGSPLGWRHGVRPLDNVLRVAGRWGVCGAQ